MEDIIILGTDIHALEVIDIISVSDRYRFIGIVSEQNDHPDDFYGHPVLGGVNDLKKFDGIKKIPMHMWSNRDNKNDWINVIAPSAFIASSAVIGRGCVIYPNCFIGANARLGDGVFMLSGSIINHDCVIEDNVTITSGVSLAGGVTVKTGAYLGQGSSIRQNLTVGRNSLVGMGAVVVKDVEDNATVAGCPARVLIR